MKNISNNLLTFTELLLKLPSYEIVGKSKALSETLRTKCVVCVKINNKQKKEFFWDLTKLTVSDQNKLYRNDIEEVLEMLNDK